MRGSSLLGRHFLNLLARRRARQLVFATLAIVGPQPVRFLVRYTGLTETRIANRLAEARAQGLVQMRGKRGCQVWGLRGQDIRPFPRRVGPKRLPAEKVAPTSSWWLTADRASFQHAAKQRAQQRGWDS